MFSKLIAKLSASIGLHVQFQVFHFESISWILETQEWLIKHKNSTE